MASRKCPHCAEKIQAEASVCKHCGRQVEPARTSAAAGCGAILLVCLLGTCMAGVCTRKEREVSLATAGVDTSSSTSSPSAPPNDLELCRAFVAARPELGRIEEVKPMEDYACGKRAAVITSTGGYSCYLKDGRVASLILRMDQKSGEMTRHVIFRDPNAECSAVTEDGKVRPADRTLPAYKVVQRMKMSEGDVFTVIVKSLRPSSKVEEMERVAREIANRENASAPGQALELYCSDAALQADRSAKYRMAHPNAMRCVLGMLKNGTFHHSEP